MSRFKEEDFSSPGQAKVPDDKAYAYTGVSGEQDPEMQMDGMDDMEDRDGTKDTMNTDLRAKRAKQMEKAREKRQKFAITCTMGKMGILAAITVVIVALIFFITGSPTQVSHTAASQPHIPAVDSKLTSPVEVEDLRHACTAMKTAKASYRFAGNSEYVAIGTEEETALKNKYHFTFVKSWKSSVALSGNSTVPLSGGGAYSEWWSKGSACFLTFRGSDSRLDARIESDMSPVDMLGLAGVHEGLAEELEPLLVQMRPDFAQIKRTCRHSIAAVGFGFGGGMAQLFSLAVNKAGDPLQSDLEVDYLFTFGATPVARQAQKNDRSADGCFKGMQYFNAERQGADVIMDVPLSQQALVDGLSPIYSGKEVLFSISKPLKFPCKDPLQGTKVNPTPAIGAFAPKVYEERMGCNVWPINGAYWS